MRRTQSQTQIATDTLFELNGFVACSYAYPAIALIIYVIQCFNNFLIIQSNNNTFTGHFKSVTKRTLIKNIQ